MAEMFNTSATVEPIQFQPDTTEILSDMAGPWNTIVSEPPALFFTAYETPGSILKEAGYHAPL